ncbi:hypothetical protein B488_04990 [Liberibacter crescens BT-1]|uniref:Uncharacterized protein n=1 Tax=Liberibacter crescens (strain BT-1) TaxID=1215343 RepID=L0EVS6_LIBCB|nr:hypothetical protein B488_04990 [Liberibacter crescens BT-1]
MAIQGFLMVLMSLLMITLVGFFGYGIDKLFFKRLRECC